MDKRNRKRTTGTGTKRNRRNQQIPNHIYLLAIAILLFVVLGMVFLSRRYTPTREHMSLSDFFVFKEAKEASVILNGESKEETETELSIIAP